MLIARDNGESLWIKIPEEPATRGSRSYPLSITKRSPRSKMRRITRRVTKCQDQTRVPPPPSFPFSSFFVTIDAYKSVSRDDKATHDLAIRRQRPRG